MGNYSLDLLINSSANNSNLQINVNGWKQVYNSNTGVTVKVNENLRLCQTTISMNKSISAKTLTTLLSSGSIPTLYRPPCNLHMNTRQDDELRLSTGGGIDYYCNLALSNFYISGSWVYSY